MPITRHRARADDTPSALVVKSNSGGLENFHQLVCQLRQRELRPGAAQHHIGEPA
jgi:hypothetical protein